MSGQECSDSIDTLEAQGAAYAAAYEAGERRGRRDLSDELNAIFDDFSFMWNGGDKTEFIQARYIRAALNAAKPVTKQQENDR